HERGEAGSGTRWPEPVERLPPFLLPECGCLKPSSERHAPFRPRFPLFTMGVDAPHSEKERAAVLTARLDLIPIGIPSGCYSCVLIPSGRGRMWNGHQRTTVIRDSHTGV